MKWIKALDNIYDFTILHSWCTQTEQMIDEFKNNYMSSPEPDLIHYLRKKVDEKNKPQEQYSISLVLLYYLGYPAENIIESANNCLYNKLNFNDLNFFKNHFFSNQYPLPEDLTYDITNRDFLSPKKAIKKAMQIESVISRENQLITVLYMTFILCRMDMNEENRAMLAFLLLKMDVDLPDSLKNRVFRYLVGLKEIIKELLDEENKASETIIKLQEEIEKLNTDQLKQNENLIENVSNEDKTNQIELQKKELHQSLNDQKKLLKVEESNKSILNALVEFAEKDENWDKKEDAIVKIPLEHNINTEIDSKSKENHFQETNYEDSAKENNNLQLKSVNNSNSKIINSEIISKQKLGPKEIKEVMDSFEDNENNIDESTDKSPTKPESPNENKPLHKIALRRNKGILESIISGLTKKGTKVNSPNVKSASFSNKIRNKKFQFGFFIIILLVFPVYLLLQSLFGNQSSVEQQIPSTSSTGTVSMKEVSVPAVIDQDSGNEDLLPADFPINFTIYNKRIQWKVSEGESISGIYYILQELKPQLKGTILEDLSKMDWDELFNAFIVNNPVRDSYHIIHPDELFILPLN